MNYLRKHLVSGMRKSIQKRRLARATRGESSLPHESEERGDERPLFRYPFIDPLYWRL